MKTVAQIAREIGVSKQAVHNKIRKEPLKSNLQGLTETIDNALQINLDGERLIKLEFINKLSINQIDELVNTTDEVTNKIDEEPTDIIKVLQEQIATLNAQNEDLRKQLNDERTHSREQADKILQLAEHGQKLAENAQSLHAMDNLKLQLTEEKKRGFFGKLFSRSKHDK